MLMHHANSELERGHGRVDVDGLPFEFNATQLWLDQPDQHFHERTFARAVFAEQRMDFAGANIKLDLLVGEQVPVTHHNV